ncbi:MAG: hypothetical protein K2K44_10695 [Oscillospiraceae bacterium]|nr:hypothetical protein [Oscillospiraceae bacterium]
MEKKHKRLKAAIIILLILIVMIYLLFFSYFPPFRTGSPNTVEISEKKALRECPEIEVTDYDREFLDKILNDPRFEELENKDKYVSMSVTADEAGFERYALRPDENYTVDASNGIAPGRPLTVSITFEYEGGLYREDLYLSANKVYPQTDYAKAVTVKRFDEKFIKQYWNFHGRYEKDTWTYGIVGFIKDIMSAMYGC